MTKISHYPGSRFIVLYREGTAEWELCETLQCTLNQILNYLGTLEPMGVIEFQPGGNAGIWRDVSEELALLWAERIAGRVSDRGGLEIESRQLPGFVENFITPEDFVDTFRGWPSSP